jgi:hypothetical protein
VQSGEWHRLLPGVLAVAAVPPSWQQRLKAAELWAGPEAAVSHRAAAALWKLDGVEGGHVELVTTGSGSQPPPEIIVHRTKLLAPGDRGLLAGIRVTGLVRTLFDLAGVVEPPIFELAAESAFRKDASLYGELATRLDHFGAHGRNGTAVVREFLRARDPAAAPTESLLETAFLPLVRAAGLPPPVRQYRVYDGPRCVIRLDFAYPDRRLGIRVHGYGCHMGRRQWVKDQDQGNLLTVLTWSVLDFSWQHLCERPADVVTVLRRAYAMVTSTS